MSDAVETVYPLTPLQEGMLFHCIRETRPDIYLSQVLCRLDGPLDLDRLELAWRQCAKRHAVMRTSFTWERRDRPLQIVHAAAECPFHTEDWTTQSSGVSGRASCSEKSRIAGYVRRSWRRV